MSLGTYWYLNTFRRMLEYVYQIYSKSESALITSKVFYLYLGLYIFRLLSIVVGDLEIMAATVVKISEPTDGCRNTVVYQLKKNMDLTMDR